MALVQARYLDGSSIHFAECKSIGHIMIHVANLHQRFAQEVAVTCPGTGRDLTGSWSQTPPSVVQIVLKPEEKTMTDLSLLAAIYFHGQYEDAATVARAYKKIQERHSEDNGDEVMSCVLELSEFKHADIKTKEAVVKTLLSVGVNLGYCLYVSAQQGRESGLRALLAAGVPVEGSGEFQDDGSGGKLYPCNSPLSAAADYGHVQVMKILLAHKADPNGETILVPQEHVGTPLSFACRSNQVDAVRELIAHKALVNAQYPGTAISLLGQAVVPDGSEEIFKLLLTSRASIQPPSTRTPSIHFFYDVCDFNSAEMLRALVDHASKFSQKHINELTRIGKLITNTVAKSSSVDMLKILLEVHKSALSGALCQAALDGKLDVANLLLDYNADADGAVSGQTPLHAASISGNLDVVGVLLSRKANVNKENYNGKTALACALDNNREDLADMLKLHGAILRGETSNEISTSKRKRESEDCLSASASKRQKSSGDKTSGKKSSLSASDVLEKKGEQNHSGFSEDSSG